MGQPALDGFKRGFCDGRVGAEIRVADLQGDDVLSACLERQDPIRQGYGGRLPDEIELSVEKHRTTAEENFRIIPFGLRKLSWDCRSAIRREMDLGYGTLTNLLFSKYNLYS